jgi:hypothetical protein
MANRAQVLDPPERHLLGAGSLHANGSVGLGGWIWRYDLAPAGPDTTKVTLAYDWSALPDSLREHIGFPPVPS